MNSDRIVGAALAFSFVFIVGLLAGERNAELRTDGPAIQVQKQQPNGHPRDVRRNGWIAPSESKNCVKRLQHGLA